MDSAFPMVSIYQTKLLGPGMGMAHSLLIRTDQVSRGTHIKNSIPYPSAFTGRDIVSALHHLIQRELLVNHNVSTNNRRIALQIAHSLQSQLFFYEVEWGNKVLQDGVEDVYLFLDDIEGGGGELSELPSGVITMMTRCYSSTCVEGVNCYSYDCPRSNIRLDPQAAMNVGKKSIEPPSLTEINR
ncbi:hypothetical protein DL96DRAFT_1677551 [Flagelloscypha sp. PMI_526]|nr:hypothetical protein DL96DRAFT_1677551 [Flagelloscypha sp. PMI_526]